MSAHRVVFLIYPGVAGFDVAGPAQALAVAGKNSYEVTLASLAGGQIETDCSGLSLGSISLASVEDPIGTLFLPGGLNAPTAAKDPALREGVRRLAARSKRIACVCTGAFLAAEAGLLSGRRAVTHWRYCDLFVERFKDVRLEPDPIWLQDGHIWSSAGVSAGVDLALALIEKDQSLSIALEVARELVVFLKRPGGQSQFSQVLSGQISDSEGPLGPLFAWIADNLGADLRAEALAKRAGMSGRTFARYFVARTGLTPAKAIEIIRIQSAREVIEQSDTPLGVVAIQYGFGDEQRMRRAFQRQLSASPAEIRARCSPRGSKVVSTELELVK
ncbi:GlxA family transcriptional regulator [Acidisoma sp. L85]|uniref:GlxA family transcriptional regulator n=1 Tax=Acidisoma sp. L85 TaxID=1641850 RepID=UPI00131CBD11|nr:helix-turn-helix domain-containing protein [Acidisoma sp. L85]